MNAAPWYVRIWDFTFVIIYVSFFVVHGAVALLLVVPRIFIVRGNKVVHFVDFDTRRRLMGISTIMAPVLKPHQVPVYRAYIIPQCGQEEIMKTKLFCLRVGKPRSSFTLSLLY